MRNILLILIFLNACILKAQSFGDFVVAPLSTTDCVASMSVIPTEIKEEKDVLYVVGSLVSVESQLVIAESEETNDIHYVKVDNEPDTEAVFDVAGRKLNSIRKGVNIVRKSDGTTKKIIVQ